MRRACAARVSFEYRLRVGRKYDEATKTIGPVGPDPGQLAKLVRIGQQILPGAHATPHSRWQPLERKPKTGWEHFGRRARQPSPGRFVSEGKHHLHQRDAVGQAVVDPREHDRPAFITVDDAHVPQGFGEVERVAHQCADHVAKGLVSTWGRQRDVRHVVRDFELRVVDPMREAASGARPHHLLMEPGKRRKAAIKDGPQSLQIDLAFEGQYAGDHHQVGRVFHAQPGGIDA